MESSSDDDKPLIFKRTSLQTTNPLEMKDKKPPSSTDDKISVPEIKASVPETDSEDDTPIGARIALKKSENSRSKKRPPEPSVKAPRVPVKKSKPSEKAEPDEDDVPLAQRAQPVKKTTPQKKKPTPQKNQSKPAPSRPDRVSPAAKPIDTQPKPGSKKQSAPRSSSNGAGEPKWRTLEHNGVIFPPPYAPHGVKVLYKGNPIDLTPEQEEAATMYAVMRETDYATREVFTKNFWNDWKKLLGPNHVIQRFEDCNFDAIWEWHLAEKEKKKLLTSEDRKRNKEEKMKLEEKYMYAIVDGVKEKVGNFRVEPPGLFRGRGDHPKMGRLKSRIYPEDITINIGKDAAIPTCPMEGHRWKEVRHDNCVTWLAFWNDPINPKEFKYVFLAASSSLKGLSDREKYEKARRLKEYIVSIRETYTRDFNSTDKLKKQIAVATYLIDRLALRAGNEKDEDEADTVGCCSLKVDHVKLIPPRSIQFDFLGKDSIRYFNTVEVEPKVYSAIGEFCRGKRSTDDLFDELDTSRLNNHLKEIMPSLTAKVFRTFNASITLDRLLQDTVGVNVMEIVADYQRANKEVAILCNHQRAVSKGHADQMEKLSSKMVEMETALQELEEDLKRARQGLPPLVRETEDEEGQKTRRALSVEALEKKVAQARTRIEKVKVDMAVKEDMKTVALGTSKINYMDPRITVAWCKKHEVPIEKVFNKSLMAKFAWAMDVEPEYRF